MSFWLVVGEGAGVNAKPLVCRCPGFGIWPSQQPDRLISASSRCPQSRYGSSSMTHWTLQATCSYFSAAGQWMTVGSVFM